MCGVESYNADHKLREICVVTAKTIYGDELPKILEVRLNKELIYIFRNNYSIHYLIASAIADCSLSSGYHITTRGTLGSSLTAFLMGITEINPLNAHYICPSCHYFELPSDGNQSVYETGYDLPEKKCPICGEVLYGDGADIIPEMSMGVDMEREPDIIINIAPDVAQDVIDMLRGMFGKDNIIGTGISVRQKDGTKKDRCPS